MKETTTSPPAFFFWFCAARSRAPCLYFQRKGHKPHFLRPFPSLLTSKGSMCFRRSERQQKCPSAPSNATVGADGDVAIVFFFLSLFSLRRPRAHVVAQTRTVPKRTEAVLTLEGGMIKGAERAVFLLIIPLFDEEEEATCVEESTCLLSFFEFPFVACCLFLLFSRLVPTSATIAFFFFFLASRSRALAYIFEKGFSSAVPVAFYIAADDKGERSVNRTLNRTLNPKRKPYLYLYFFIFKKMFLVGSGGGGERNRQTENSKAQKTSSSSRSPLPTLGHTLRGSAPRRP